jgi:hypothetical protein
MLLQLYTLVDFLVLIAGKKAAVISGEPQVWTRLDQNIPVQTRVISKSFYMV